MASRRPASSVTLTGFTQLPGAGSFVAASPDGSIWVLSTEGGGADKYIFHYVNGTWTNVPGAAMRLAVGPDNTLWAVNSAGGIYAFNGSTWSTIAGGASDIAVAADGSVYVISSQGGGAYGRGIWRYANGTWTQLRGAGIRVVANWDPGTYPGNIAPGGVYVINAALSIFFYNPASGFTQIPGAAYELAATTNGGLFALGVPAAVNGDPIYYDDLASGTWTLQPGAATSVATNSASVYVIGSGGGIYRGPITPRTTSAQIVADASLPGPAMTKDQLGTNLLVGINSSGDPSYVPTFKRAAIGLFRWPGGSESDAYHWSTNTFSSCSSFAQYQPVPQVAFDTWMQNVAKPAGADVAITVNYGSNADCSGGGDPAEAAAWVDHANNAMHDGITYWTVGNEQYFPETDYNSPAHDAGTYASRVANLFYPMMKAKDPTIKVGVTMAFGNQTQSVANDPWDATVLAQAQYDFVEMHYYPNYNNGGTDQALLTTQSDQLAAAFANARTLLGSYGHGGVPIFLGEFDRDSGLQSTGFEGHQSLSVVDALFTDIVIAEAAKAGVTMTTSWLGIDYCASDPQPPPNLYGWQTFGSWGLAAAGGSGFSLSCADKGVPQGTLFPKERAYEVASHFVTAGAHVLTTRSGDAAVRAYGATQNGGYAFLLINTDGTNAHAVTVGVDNTAAAQFTATTLTYGKAEYDLSKTGTWAGPTAASLGRVANPVSVTLPPWSATALQLAP